MNGKNSASTKDVSYKDLVLRWAPDENASTSIAITAAERSSISKIRKLRIKHIIVPTTFYAISSINNTIILQESGESTSVDITLTSGNYTGSQFATEVADQLDNATTSGRTYTASVNPINGKITITVSSGDFELFFRENDIQREKIWGVPHGTVGYTANVAGGADLTSATAQIISASSSYVSPHPLQLWGPDKIFIKSDQIYRIMAEKNIVIADTPYTGVYGVDNSGNPVTHSDIIAMVPISVTPFAQEVYSPLENVSFGINDNIAQNTLSFSVTDESNNIIDFNGGYINMVLLIHS